MKRFRLLDLPTARLETYEIGHAPPYLAVSHAWSDQIFSNGVESSFGGTAVKNIIAERFPSVRKCWIDNFCIKQDDEADKLEQLPLMGDIYHRAEVVAVVLTCNFGFTQVQVDHATAVLKEAVEVWRDQTWAEEEFLDRWKFGSERKLLVQAMEGLAKLTKSSWATRIWTLQEYILASSIVWIGSDLSPVMIEDVLFQAIPGLCDQLFIRECISRSSNSEFAILYTHFSGMANSRLNTIDRTRTMELLGNRKATVPVDEVYGIMAACGVEIDCIYGELKEEAWRRWWEAAVCRGHVRWALLPPAPLIDQSKEPGTSIGNCVIPEFSSREAVSSASYLDSVRPVREVNVDDGTLTLSGRLVGNCTLLRKLGSIHKSRGGFYHRDITVILFARGSWGDALQVVKAFGSGRYNRKQEVALAQLLVDNHSKAVRYVRMHNEVNFRYYFRTTFHKFVWEDFLQFQGSCIMDGLAVGIGYLAHIHHSGFGISITTAVIMGNYMPTGSLVALDFNAITADERMILLIAEVPADALSLDESEKSMSLHKLGTTIPVTVDYNGSLGRPSIEKFCLGGSSCHVCTTGVHKQFGKVKAQSSPTSRSLASMIPERAGILLHKDRSERVFRLRNIWRTLNFSELNRSRKRYLRLTRR